MVGQQIDTGYYFSDIKLEDSFVNKARRMLTSSLLLIVAFILSNLLVQGLIALVAKYLKYTVKFSYNHIEILPHYFHYWSILRVLAIYIAPLIACLVIGMILMRILRSNTKWVNIFRLFIFWFMTCLVNIFFSNILFSPLGVQGNMSCFYQTFAILGSWLGFNTAFMCVFMVFAITGSILWGLGSCKEVLRFSFSSKLISTNKGRNLIIGQVYLFPVLLGAIPIVLLNDNGYLFSGVVIMLNLMLFAIGMFVSSEVDWSDVRCNKKDVLNHFPAIELLIVTALWLAVYRFLR